MGRGEVVWCEVAVGGGEGGVGDRLDWVGSGLVGFDSV